MRSLPIPLVLPLVALLAACGGSQPPAETAQAEETPKAAETVTPPSTAEKPAADTNVPEALAAVVAAPDRAEADRALDAGRKPAELLAFLDIRPGMKVAEIAAGGGYTAELLARAVGETGKVYGSNSKFILERFAEKPWAERLQKPVMKNVVRVDREFDDPLPPEAKDLDAVVMVLFYHDTVWMKTDRDKMNKNIFNALRSGGVYGIVDHSAKAGAGTSEAQTTHRIEEKVLREEVERAGFKLAGEASFLRNEKDTRDWNASPMKAGEMRGTSDRFVLKFVKP
ncbi:class I SAM-dependent methyltransferase [Polyangium spumosum]|uniref:SAM-dependent methyltransferase n=1 Tax=Polyangium spumosum TaxID=889282 RepID=A0A6N7PEI1_9BACT|nr:class I SAM-dependent methyltransferase [Polyangium spumosum]MRG90369.1 SAM-dependent methyltransferase [Polyangium spumosum]